MRFAGDEASNEYGVIENGKFHFFCFLYLPNLHKQCNMIVVPHWTFTNTKTDDAEIEWPFCIKSFSKWYVLGVHVMAGSGLRGGRPKKEETVRKSTVEIQL